MKRLLYILFVLILAACSSDDSLFLSNSDSDTVDLKFNVTVPEVQVSSRAMGNDTFNHLYLLVFEKSGYFAYQAEAKNLSHSGTQSTGLTYTFTVTLKKSSDKRIIHFIATNQVINYSTPGPEYLLKSLTTTAGADAYWQRRELVNGITESTKLQNVPLVRNFAKIVVQNASDSGLSDITYAVMNTLSSGTIVPEIVSEESSFPEFFNGDNNCYTYNELLDSHYIGFEDGNATITNSDALNIAFNSIDTPYYMYEHSARSANNTFVIIRGKYKNEYYYYKIDLVYDNTGGNNKIYYNLLRNFEYTININSILKEGHATAAEAYSSPADNNLSSSVETKNLSNISDGKSQLLVSYIDTTLVTSDVIYLKYKFIPDISSSTDYNNGLVNFDIDSNGNVINSYEKVPGVDSNGFSSLKIQPKDYAGTTVSQNIHLYASVSSSTILLSRDVNITLRDKPSMKLEVDSPISNDLNSPVQLRIKLENGLPKAIFPMEFKIESEINSIYPEHGGFYMPVSVGVSINPDNNSRNYGFLRNITYDEYENNENGVLLSGDDKIVACNFNTNCENSATKIFVYNKYCGTENTSFQNQYISFVIPAGAITAGSKNNGFSNQEVYIYQDKNYTNNIASYNLSRKYKNNNNKYYYGTNENDISIKIPVDITTLYFKCGSFTTFASVSDLENASADNPLTINL